MSLIGNFVSQVYEDLIKGLEMTNILGDKLFGKRIRFLEHKSVESFLIFRDNFPSGTDTGEDFRQILNPTIEILILHLQFLILSPVRLQPNGHLRILFDQKFNLEILILHVLCVE